MTNVNRVQAGVPTGGEFATGQRQENPDMEVTPPAEPKIIRSYIKKGDLAWIEFEPVPVEYGQWKLMLNEAYTWEVNGPHYTLGRGKVIRKDGTVGTRVIETYPNVIPKNIQKAMHDMFADRDAKVAAAAAAAAKDHEDLTDGA